VIKCSSQKPTHYWDINRRPLVSYSGSQSTRPAGRQMVMMMVMNNVILNNVMLTVVCVCNVRRPRYHSGAWCARRWACCDAERRSAPGCQLATVWPLPEPQLEILVQNENAPNDVAREYFI
jgi:hypothetical protein